MKIEPGQTTTRRQNLCHLRKNFLQDEFPLHPATIGKMNWDEKRLSLSGLPQAGEKHRLPVARTGSTKRDELTLARIKKRGKLFKLILMNCLNKRAAGSPEGLKSRTERIGH